MPQEQGGSAYLIEAYQPDDAYQRVQTFARRFGPDHIALAMHAALPLGLTPDIIHLIRINFVPSAPWIAEADILLSPLCRQVGRDLYEMEPAIRELLLEELKEDEEFGPEAKRGVAEFLLSYSSRVSNLPEYNYLQDFLRAQQWVAMAYVDPEEASRSLAKALERGMASGDRSEMLRVANITQTLSAPLFTKQKELIYTAGVKRMIQREYESAQRMFDALGPADQRPTVGGISLPAFTELQSIFGASEIEQSQGSYPAGLRLRAVLRAESGATTCVAWSPDGSLLASRSGRGTIQIWGVKRREVERGFAENDEVLNQIGWSPDGKSLTFISLKRGLVVRNLEDDGTDTYLPEPHPVNCFAWAAHGRMVATGAIQGELWLWPIDASGDIESEKHKRGKVGRGAINALSWSPNGQTIACAMNDGEITICDGEDATILRKVNVSMGPILCLARSADEHNLICGLSDGRIILIDNESGRLTRILEAHTSAIAALSLSYDGRLLASKSHDGIIRLWRTDEWSVVAVLDYSSSRPPESAMAFHPKEPVIATVDEDRGAIRIWNYDPQVLLALDPPAKAISYRSAKVVLLGDAGVGKSGLALALTGRPFEPTPSTHGHRIWRLESQEVKLDDETTEVREVYLWDLGGQPFYRFLYPLTLSDVSVALIVFFLRDSSIAPDSVRHWSRTLRQSQRESTLKAKSLLIAARMDEGMGLNSPLLEWLMSDLGIGGYIQTSAKEGVGITELRDQISAAIDWEALPAVIAPQSFHDIQKLVASERASGQVLIDRTQLYFTYLESRNIAGSGESLKGFDACLTLLESRGLIRVLEVSSALLLLPELLDICASKLLDLASRDSDGQGRVFASDALDLQFALEENEGVIENVQASLIIAEAIKRFINNEIVIRDQRDDLIFPSQVTREYPGTSEPQLNTVAFKFDGIEISIYTTLVVKLSLSDDFEMRELWKDTATFYATYGGICGLSMRSTEEGGAELTLFFDHSASKSTREQFEQFVHSHLLSRAIPESVKRRRIVTCPSCRTVIGDVPAQIARDQGGATIPCPVCGAVVPLYDDEEIDSQSAQPPPAPEAASEYNVALERDITVKGPLRLTKGSPSSKASPSAKQSSVSGKKSARKSSKKRRKPDLK